MHERGKSDRPVIPAKLPNNTGSPGAEAVEGRGLAEGNLTSSTHPGHRAGEGVPSGAGSCAGSSTEGQGWWFTALLHHVTPARLYAAYLAIRPQAAPGVDGVTRASYGMNLEANLGI